MANKIGKSSGSTKISKSNCAFWNSQHFIYRHWRGMKTIKWLPAILKISGKISGAALPLPFHCHYKPESWNRLYKSSDPLNFIYYFLFKKNGWLNSQTRSKYKFFDISTFMQNKISLLTLKRRNIIHFHFLLFISFC